MTLRILALFFMSMVPASAFASSGFSQQSIGPGTSVYGGQDIAVSLIASTSVTQDNNLFRLAGNANPVTSIGSATKSDTIASASVGIKIDKSYKMQNLTLNASVTKNQYSNFSRLNHDDIAFSAAWNWSLTPKVTGVLNASRNQSLANYADVQSYVRNISTTDSLSFNMDWWLAARWHALFGVNQSTSSSSAPTLQNLSTKMTGTELGLRYESSPGNSVTAKIRDLRGIYSGQALDLANLIDNSYKQREMTLDFSWLPTGKSNLYGNLTYMNRSHDHLPQRNLSGTSASLGYRYTFSGKSALNISLNQSFSPYFVPNAIYRDGNGNIVFVSNSNNIVQNDIIIQPIWAVTPRASLHMAADFGSRDYKNPVPIAGLIPLQQQHDTTQSLSLGLDWTPTRYLSLSSSVQQSRRSSNNSTFKYDDTLASITAKIYLDSGF
ncbi:MAG: hypothetical protein K2P57_11540 [Burkholderiales bacterium]|nr:hypothetical protein [Burkholderiales bacterium]